MKKTIINWKQLSKVMNDPNFKEKPVIISFKNGKLESLTFETYKKIKKNGKRGKK